MESKTIKTEIGAVTVKLPLSHWLAEQLFALHHKALLSVSKNRRKAMEAKYGDGDCPADVFYREALRTTARANLFAYALKVVIDKPGAVVVSDAGRFLTRKDINAMNEAERQSIAVMLLAGAVKHFEAREKVAPR